MVNMGTLSHQQFDVVKKLPHQIILFKIYFKKFNDFFLKIKF